MTENGSTPSERDPRPSMRRVALVLPVGALVTLVSLFLIGESEAFRPEVLARFFLFGFTLVIWALLLVLTFVLGRNLVKLFLERRRSELGTSFKTKLVATYIATAVAVLLQSKAVTS